MEDFETQNYFIGKSKRMIFFTFETSIPYMKVFSGLGIFIPGIGDFSRSLNFYFPWIRYSILSQFNNNIKDIFLLF